MSRRAFHALQFASLINREKNYAKDTRRLRIVVAVALTAAVLWRANPARVLAVAGNADLRWIGGAVALVLIDRALMAYRWVALLVALTPGSRPPISDVLRVFFVSTFVGTFLPSVGGDVYRAYRLSKLRVNGAESAASVLMDRVLGVLSIVAIGTVALLTLGRDWMSGQVVFVLLSATIACAAVAVAVFSRRAASAAQMLASRLPHPRLQRIGAALVDAMRRYAPHHRTLVGVLLGSVAVQAIRVLQAWYLGRALGITAPLAIYFVFIPIILLIMLLPITVNGLGTGQVAFDALFGRVGVPSSDAFALSVLFIALGVVGNLPGGVLYAMRSRSYAESQAP